MLVLNIKSESNKKIIKLFKWTPIKFIKHKLFILIWLFVILLDHNIDILYEVQNLLHLPITHCK